MFGSCEMAVKEGYGDREGFKCCGYCGSMDPVELADLIVAGEATMSGSDWKYGWPHKFYVDVINPHPDKQVVKHSRLWWENGERKEEVEYGPQGAMLHLKFYSEHLGLLDNETFAKVAPIISEACGITWTKENGKLYYQAPCHNYQKGWHH
jgi:hypothetical protein